MKTLLFALLFTTVASARDLVKTQLLADVSSIAPGQTFTVGVKLNMEPGWHVYWINPGETGLVTTVKFDLPQGFKVGEVMYPVPRKFEITGGITAYGYEDEVMLMAEVTAPKDLKEGSTVKIAATTKWLACNPDQCIPGQAKDEIRLKVGSVKQAANEAEFAKWREQIPQTTSDAKVDVQMNAPGQQFKSATGKIVVDWKGKTPQKVEWFPVAPEQLLVTPGQISTENGVSTIEFKADALPGEKISDATFSSVVAYTMNGQRRGVLVPVRIVPGSNP
jgi:DsbC/DsbD-like thiol-disulfide interchange protein